MAKELTPIYYANNDTPMMLIALANTIVDTIATEIITANTDSAGGLTTGNAQLSGIFAASVVVPGEIRGGSVATSANLVLSSNLYSASPSVITIKIGNTTLNSTSINVQSLAAQSAAIDSFSLNKVTVGNTEISALTFQANSSADQVFDYFAKASYRSAEYLVSLSDTTPGPTTNAYQVMKVLVVHDGTSSYVTEYGIVTSNGIVGVVNASANVTSVLVTVSPSVGVANIELQATRIIQGA